ncbi:MAG: hypothetical protein QM778_16455 [Myxococcales bacterium]
MLSEVLRNTEWREFGDFVSPAILKVMPASSAWRVANVLRRHRQDRTMRQTATHERRALLEQAGIAVELDGVGDVRRVARDVAFTRPAERARRVAELYFQQLFQGDVTFLDLRTRTFSEHDGHLSWQPAPWMWRWDAAFIEPLRDIYRGFYGEDEALFQRGLEQLSLTPAQAIFRKHFGGEQQRVTFHTRHFVSTFHDVFLCCRAHHITLSPSFLPLGLYLATLYEHLERLGVEVDVRMAFQRVVRPRSN